jgi:large subunit ribosomal protein L23
MTSITRSYEILKKPVITEKGSDDTASRNAYHFRVPVDANKVEIRQAVEQLFKVKVSKVNTLRVTPKARRRGWVSGFTQEWKKAMVVLQEGHAIDLI